jgi:hypothetical protein
MAICAVLAAPAAFAQTPPDLIVSGTTYQDVGQASTLVAGSSLLAPTTLGGSNTVAAANGQYQNVFLNAGADASFGVTSQIFLQNLATNSTYEIDPAAVVGSFSSKSELALNVSSDGSAITFMAYNPQSSYSSTGAGGIASVTTGGNNNLGLVDISNSNTPGLIDPTNGVNATAYRTVTQVSVSSLLSGTSGTLSTGSGLSLTNTDAYSGNNGRAVVLYDNQYYIVGNAGNTGTGVTGATRTLLAQNTGVQTITPGSSSALSTVVGACSGTSGSTKGYQCGFNITSTGAAADTTGKDDNFRGLTAYNGSLYVSKGSGSNGVDSVYQVSGLSSPSTATVSILPGFPTATTTGATGAPFGMFFANPSTLYVAYEGGDAIAGAGGTLANEGGLVKYSLIKGNWQADYTISAGLGSFSGGAVGKDTGSTTFYTDGLRNLTGQVNANGTVTLFAVTSTLTDAGAGTTWDQGANPDQVVSLTDTVSATTAASQEEFSVLETSAEGTVYRGVALAPVPLPASSWLLLGGLGGFGFVARNRRRAPRCQT